MICDFCEVRKCNDCSEKSKELESVMKFIENILNMPFLHFNKFKPVIECFLLCLKDIGMIKDFELELDTSFKSDIPDKRRPYCSVSYTETELNLKYKSHNKVIVEIKILHRDRQFRTYFPNKESFIVNYKIC